MGWLADIMGKRRLNKAKEQLFQRAAQFNQAHANISDFSQWMCPACGKVTKGKQFRTRSADEVHFPPCCDKFDWEGTRNFHLIR